MNTTMNYVIITSENNEPKLAVGMKQVISIILEEEETTGFSIVPLCKETSVKVLAGLAAVILPKDKGFEAGLVALAEEKPLYEVLWEMFVKELGDPSEEK